MRKRIVIAGLLLLALFTSAMAQQNGMRHKRSDGYMWPTDSLVLEKLDKWKDLKFGVIFHWGLYSVPGILESWVLCGEDVDWIKRPQNMTYEEYKKWYWGLKDSLNPVKFNPEQWVDIMKKGGMRYMVFTTKHHEGFCMFDTKQTDFSIMNGPFSKNPRANIAKHVFESFRKQGFMIGAYFSKPDWHSEYYWWPYYPTRDRNVNYDVKRHPERWEKFRQFTFNQIQELMSDYGNIDILWLDGGQVAKRFNQDIRMDKIATMARQKQPGLIMVDRTVKGEFENYQTPEDEIPATQLDIPWETCLSMNGWGWRCEGEYKSAKRIIATLIEVVAKGGNLLLGVGPTPQGVIDDEATERILSIGQWLDKNGKAIYSTLSAKHYKDGNVWFTMNKNEQTMYAIYALPENEKEVPEIIEWTENIPVKKNKVFLLQNHQRVKCEVENNKVRVYLPKNIDRSASLAFSFEVRK